MVAALLWVVRVTAGLMESNGSLPPGLWLTSSAGWLPRTGISSGTLRSVIEYGLPLSFLSQKIVHWLAALVNVAWPAAYSGHWRHTVFLALRTNRNNKFVFSFLRQLTTWHCPHSTHCCVCAVQQSTDISCLLGHHCNVWTGTDRRTLDRQTLYCYIDPTAYCVTSAND